MVRWEVDDLAAAHKDLDARFAAGEGAERHEPARRTADSRPAIAEPNVASASMARWRETYRLGSETGNWEPMRQACAPDFAFADRRRMNLLEGDFELMLASARERAAAGARFQNTTIGTAGDRVVIDKVLWSGGPADGPFEIEYLAVSECDEAGRVSAFVLLDLDDARAAQREAWARWAAIDPASAAVTAAIGEQVDAFNAHDPARYRAVLADDLVVEDRRRAGMGRIDDADAYVASLVALWDLAPVTRVEAGWHWPAFEAHGAITDVRRVGTLPEGGDFESEHLHLCTLAGDLVTRIELFEVDDLDAALARLEELRPESSR
jgi:hypothetical protein